jgi:hypothetical protein
MIRVEGAENYYSKRHLMALEMAEATAEPAIQNIRKVKNYGKA